MTLGQKWVEELPERPIMVFDREGHGAGFFSGLVKEEIPFVTWEKHADSKKLEAIDDGEFTEDFEFNGKEYSVFEGEKALTYSPEDAEAEKHDFRLRPFFNEENELVDLFYAITNCHGWIKCTRNKVIARLEPLQQPKRRLAQEQLCRKLTSLGAKTPSGKRLIIEVGKAPI